MKYLVARDMGSQYRFVVLLDESKVDAQGNPDPAYVREYAWAKNMPLEDIQREIRLLAEHEISRMNEGQPLPIEGMTV